MELQSNYMYGGKGKCFPKCMPITSASCGHLLLIMALVTPVSFPRSCRPTSSQILFAALNSMWLSACWWAYRSGFVVKSSIAHKVKQWKWKLLHVFALSFVLPSLGGGGCCSRLCYVSPLLPSRCSKGIGPRDCGALSTWKFVVFHFFLLIRLLPMWRCKRYWAKSIFPIEAWQLLVKLSDTKSQA